MSKTGGKRGRPTRYTPELGELICARMATGMSLRAVCSADDIPPESTVRGWALDTEHPFFAHYTRARQMQAHAYADRIADIAAKAEGGEIDPKAAQAAIHGFAWSASRIAPKAYGDRQHIETEQRVTYLKAVPEADIEGAI